MTSPNIKKIEAGRGRPQYMGSLLLAFLAGFMVHSYVNPTPMEMRLVEGAAKPAKPVTRSALAKGAAKAATGLAEAGLKEVSTTTTTQGATEKKQPRKIFIDLGANCGNSYLKIKKAGNINGHKDILKDDTWETYLWEANPQLVKFYLNDIQKKDPGVHIVAAAAATQDTTLTFYLTKGQDIGTDSLSSLDEITPEMKEKYNYECNPDSGRQPAGASSLLADVERAGTPIDVPAKNFAQWLQDFQITPHDRLVLKIDIEGAEIDILDTIMTSDQYDAICQARPLLVEWHSHLFPEGSANYNKHEAFQKNFPSMYKKKCNRNLDMMKWH